MLLDSSTIHSSDPENPGLGEVILQTILIVFVRRPIEDGLPSLESNPSTLESNPYTSFIQLYSLPGYPWCVVPSHVLPLPLSYVCRTHSNERSLGYAWPLREVSAQNLRVVILTSKRISAPLLVVKKKHEQSLGSSSVSVVQRVNNFIQHHCYLAHKMRQFERTLSSGQ